MGAPQIAIAGTSAQASAHETYRTSCRGNDCVRFLSDERGQDCFLVGYFDRREEGRPVCNEYSVKRAASPQPLRDCENDVYSNNGPRYHYKNHFDPDNDYEEYPN